MASKRTCPACHADFIVGKKALFAARTGARMATVCQACFNGGLTVVQDKTGDVEKCVDCERNAACLCTLCAKRRETKARGEAFGAGLLSGKPMG